MTSRNELDDTAGYAEAVRAALDDLSAEERASLLDDLEAHLAEVAAESEAPLVERLGSPEDYAAEMRAAYGATPGARGRSRRRIARRGRLAYILLLIPIGVGLWFAGQAITSGSRADQWSSAHLVSEAQAGHISKLDVQGSTAVATDRNGGRHDVALSSSTEELAATMTRAGVNVAYHPQQSGIPFHAAWLVVLLLTMLVPLGIVALLVAGFLYLLRRPAGPRRAA